MKKLFFVALISFLSNEILCQNRNELSKIAEPIDEASEFIYLKKDKKIKHSELFKNKKAFGLTSSDEMRLIKKKNDELGYSHFYYKHFYKSIPVEGSEYVVHEKEGAVEFINGAVIKELNLNMNSIIDMDKALSRALSSLDVQKYKWEDPHWELELRQAMKDSSATYYPKGSLEIVNLDYSVEKKNLKENYVLAYSFKIHTLIPEDYFHVLINAKNGLLIRKISLRIIVKTKKC